MDYQFVLHLRNIFQPFRQQIDRLGCILPVGLVLGKGQLWLAPTQFRLETICLRPNLKSQNCGYRETEGALWWRLQCLSSNCWTVEGGLGGARRVCGIPGTGCLTALTAARGQKPTRKLGDNRVDTHITGSHPFHVYCLITIGG